MTTMTAPLNTPLQPAKRWFREPYVWLVIGGPLAVVAASIVTVYLAVTTADTVVSAPPAAVQVEPQALQGLSPKERTAAELSVMPAGQARNHVVTPTLPKD